MHVYTNLYTYHIHLLASLKSSKFEIHSNRAHGECDVADYSEEERISNPNSSTKRHRTLPAFPPASIPPKGREKNGRPKAKETS